MVKIHPPPRGEGSGDCHLHTTGSVAEKFPRWFGMRFAPAENNLRDLSFQQEAWRCAKESQRNWRALIWATSV